jgi:flavodoxin
MKRTVVIYDTKFGNTEKVAGALRCGLETDGVKVDCVKVDEVDVDKLVEYDFIAIGGPTHMAGMSKLMKAFLEELKTIDISGKKGFCFDTRVHSHLNRFDLNSAAKRIEKKMKKMKVKMIKPRKSVLVEGREGPLETGAQQTFEKVGKELTELIQ